jgi:hypothetical protein
VKRSFPRSSKECAGSAECSNGMTKANCRPHTAVLMNVFNDYIKVLLEIHVTAAHGCSKFKFIAQTILISSGSTGYFV